MVLGVFVGRWTVPMILKGTAYVFQDIREKPHLILWAVLAGSLWAVANTLTIFAIRDVGLSIAFPIWNTNSLIGLLWGRLLFGELSGSRQRNRVLGGAAAITAGAWMLAYASSIHVTGPTPRAAIGITAALGAGILWGTMYIPYRKAYLTGMNPLSFITFFTVGELLTMLILAVTYRGTIPLAHELSGARSVLFWLMLGGFVWVIGDLFQQYATKYVGISRGIPLSNTNQLWGLLWGVLVFHELSGGGRVTYEQVVGGSILMASGAVAIALSSATEDEHSSWKDAAQREGKRYGVEDEYLHAGMEGRGYESASSGRSTIDWILILVTTALFAALAVMAQPPKVHVSFGWAAALTFVMFTLMAACGVALWRITRFR